MNSKNVASSSYNLTTTTSSRHIDSSQDNKLKDPVSSKTLVRKLGTTLVNQNIFQKLKPSFQLSDQDRNPAHAPTDGKNNKHTEIVQKVS